MSAAAAAAVLNSSSFMGNASRVNGLRTKGVEAGLVPRMLFVPCAIGDQLLSDNFSQRFLQLSLSLVMQNNGYMLDSSWTD